MKPTWTGLDFLGFFSFFLKEKCTLSTILQLKLIFSRNNLNVSLSNVHYNCSLEMEIKFLFFVTLSLYLHILKIRYLNEFQNVFIISFLTPKMNAVYKVCVLTELSSSSLAPLQPKGKLLIDCGNTRISRSQFH